MIKKFSLSCIILAPLRLVFFVSDWENQAVDSLILWITPHINEVTNDHLGSTCICMYSVDMLSFWLRLVAYYLKLVCISGNALQRASCGFLYRLCWNIICVGTGKRTAFISDFE